MNSPALNVQNKYRTALLKEFRKENSVPVSRFARIVPYVSYGTFRSYFSAEDSVRFHPVSKKSWLFLIEYYTEFREYIEDKIEEFPHLVE